MKEMKEFAVKRPLLFMITASAVIGVLAGIIVQIYGESLYGTSGESFREISLIATFGAIVLGETVILPVLLMIAEVIALIRQITGKTVSEKIWFIDMTAIILGIAYNYLMLGLVKDVIFVSRWDEVLFNSQMHAPILVESYPVFWFVIFVGVAGYLIVSFNSIDKMPPLAFVLGFSAMYLGTAMSIVWAIQTFVEKTLIDYLLLILPICCICITARTVLYKVAEWKAYAKQGEVKEYGKFLQKCNRILQDSNCWPIAAFLLMWPLLGIIIGLMVLLGQKPDAIIRAWTETSDWNLSQKVAPQNVFRDEHYLCTVAAGGHEDIVKPLRLGVRHDHKVIVNRQLCIANAFEQVLEEKTPLFHKYVRGIYDKYGFPVAKLIKSKWAADITYVIMKPLEWFFLIILYLVDAKPENRIAIQYTGKGLKDFVN